MLDLLIVLLVFSFFGSIALAVIRWILGVTKFVVSLLVAMAGVVIVCGVLCIVCFLAVFALGVLGLGFGLL